MKTKTASKKTTPKKITKKRRKRIYINEIAWYYEDDPFHKQKMEAAVALLKDLDWSYVYKDENRK